MTWQTRASRTVYENRWIRVEENDVVGPHGEGIYGVVEMQHPAVFVVAVDDDDRVCLVARATRQASWEVPAGGSDGEDPRRGAASARRGGRHHRGTLDGARADERPQRHRAPEFVFAQEGISRVRMPTPLSTRRASTPCGGSRSPTRCA
jgi:hypothetical protein